MLTIKDFDGNDLIQLPPDEVTLSVSGATTARVDVQCRIIEDDPALSGQQVTGTLDWNDGSASVSLGIASGTLSVDSVKQLAPGDYSITVTGRNYAFPDMSVVSVNFPVTVAPDYIAPLPDKIVFGPILPRDAGFPNASQWQLDLSSDTAILESSVKMLLITNKGERIALPDYGTNLRRILFEPGTSAVEALVIDEITAALAQWEPRVGLREPIIVNREGRSALVTANFVSKLTREPFEINLEF